MSDPAQPPAARALRRVWRSSLPHDFAGAVAFAPSGEWVAVGSSGDVDGSSSRSVASLTMFDTRNGGVVHQIDGDWMVGSLAFSPDSRSLATGESRGLNPESDYRARVLDAGTFAERCHYAGHSGGYSEGLCFSPDGAWVAGGRSTNGQQLFVFDAMNGAERWRRYYPMASFAISPDLASVAMGSYADGVVVLEASTGAERRRITVHTPVLRVAYSPDNRWIVAGCLDGTIRVFNADSGVQEWSVRAAPADHEGPVVSVAVSDDAHWVAAVSSVNFLQGSSVVVGILGVYDLARGTPRFPPVRLGNPGEVWYSPTLRHVVVNGPYGWREPLPGPRQLTVIDARTGLEDSNSANIYYNFADFAVARDGGSIAATAVGFVEMYDLDLEVSRYAVDAILTSIDMSPAGTPLVAVADKSSAVTVIVASDGTWLGRQPIPGTIASTVFADNGQAVAAGSSTGVQLFSIVGARRWTVDTIGPVNALAAAGPAGEWIATAAGRTVRLLSSTDGHSRWPSPNIHPQTVTRIAASFDGKRIATGCADHKTRIVDALTGTETFSVGGSGRVQDLAFTLDGALLATGNEDGTIVIIDTASASVRARVTRLYACTHIAFSHDAMLLAAAWDDNKNTVSIFDITGSTSSPPLLREFTNAAPISGLAFNPVEYTVAVAIAGASVVVYDVREGIELVRILQPTPVSHFVFSADGALIATTSDDGMIRVWISGLQPSDR